jgi:CRP/FNR family transcriptional regulator, cyclic AMP receptor protein
MFNFTNNPFKKSYSIKELNLFRFFAKNYLFEKLTKEEMAVFIPYLHIRNFQKNEAIFFRNDPSRALYIVKTGRVSINIDVADRFEFLKFAKPCESFGNNALLSDTTRVYNAIVDSDYCDLYVIPQVNIMEIFEGHIAIRAKMLTALSEMYNQSTVNLFKAYQSTFGFFDLSQAYMDELKI